jgi:hypothetical protein
VQVDLRPVEDALALSDAVLDAVVLQRLRQRALGVVPERVVAQAIVGPRRQLGVHREVEHPVDLVGEGQHLRDLVLDLLLGAEDVGVVLDEVAHPHEAVQRAARLAAVQQPGLGVAHGQVAIRPLLHAEERAVAGAVHRLEPELPVLVLGDEDVLLVLAPVPRGLPQVRLVEQRRLDLDVAALLLHAPVEGDQGVEHRGSLRQPERRPR